MRLLFVDGVGLRLYGRLIILFLYIVLVLFGVNYHEPWRDEAHVWRAARDNTITGLVTDSRFEGIPLLWTMTLAPFAKAGMPYPLTMQLIHVSFAIGAVGLFLFFARIPLVTKILFIFSYYISYEYAVIARIYVPAITLLFSIAALYPKRFVYPRIYAIFILLLFQTNSFSIIPAAMLMILFVLQMYRDKHITYKNITAFLIMITGAVFTISTLYLDPSISFSTLPPQNALLEIPKILRNSIVPSFDQFPLDLIQSQQFTIKVITGLSFLSFIVMIWKKTYLFILSVVLFGWLFFINSVAHAGGLRHFGMLLIYLMFLYWIYETHRMHHSHIQKIIRVIFLISLNFLLFISVLYSVYIYNLDFRYNFSGAKNMAEYIKSNDLEKLDTIIFLGGNGEAVWVYFNNKKYWSPEFDQNGYVNLADFRYQKRMQTFSTRDALNWINKKFSGYNPYLLLLSFPIDYPDSEGYRLLHISEANQLGFLENFWLYTNVKK